MSYEGHIQFLCKNGHYWEEGYMYGEKQGVCPTCKEEAVWDNSVDDTNCDNLGEIDMAAFLVKPAKKCVCSCCGNTHNKSDNVYRIPNPYETVMARTYWNSATGNFELRKPSEPVIVERYIGLDKPNNATIVKIELTPTGPKILSAKKSYPEKPVKLTKNQEKEVLELVWPGYTGG